MLGRSRHLTLAIAATLVAALLATGCGSKKEDTAPAACIERSDAYLRDLQAAPSQVVLGQDVAAGGSGQTLISDCLVPEQEGGQLADVGQSMIVAATKLNAEARQNPGGTAAVRLGYLIGAASKGADPIHTDLIRRLNAAAHFSEGGGTLPTTLERSFARGYAAGQRSG